MSAQQQAAKKAKANSETCVVICKLPMGMMLHLHKTVTEREVIPNGSRETIRNYQDEDAGYIRINGSAHMQNEGPRYRMVGGFAITERVPKEFVDIWMKQTGQHLKAVKEHLIQVHPDIDRAMAAARDYRKALVGLERLDPNNLPVTDRRFELKKADEMVAIIGTDDSEHIEE